MTKKATSKKSASTRENLPVALRTDVLTEAGYRCAVPTCRMILAIDLHHMIEVSEGGGDSISNLIALCPSCHALFHRGTIRRESIYVWKGMLVSLSRAFDYDSIDLLLFLSGMKSEFYVSLDGLLRFARLSASNFVQVSSPIYRASNDPAAYRICLSDAGKQFVEAWKTGDRDSLEQALTHATRAV